MKSWISYSFAAAVVAAFVGWYVEGFLEAQEQIGGATIRAGYVDGAHYGSALVWAIGGFCFAALVGFGIRSTKRSTRETAS